MCYVILFYLNIRYFPIAPSYFADPKLCLFKNSPFGNIFHTELKVFQRNIIDMFVIAIVSQSDRTDFKKNSLYLGKFFFLSYLFQPIDYFFGQ
jgi:hypothetical protein